MKCLFCLVATAFATLQLISSAGAANPVCIVGAGPAGLTIANKLQAKGVDTVIFEKNPEVGGKCQAYYDELYVVQFGMPISNAMVSRLVQSLQRPISPHGRTSLRKRDLPRDSAHN
jgi:heterodisulfide reductase subunit A-like polyferredoxin